MEQDDNARLEDFVAWLKGAALPLAASAPGPQIEDLEPLREIVGGARVVGVGESFHGVREFLGLRLRVTQFLIERMGFDAVALESGFPEGRMVYDYVLGGERPERLWEEGITWTMGEFPGTRELVEWLREHNRRTGRKVRFYGMDVAGAKGSWRSAAEQVFRYLDLVEPEWSTEMRGRLMPLIARFERQGRTAKDFNAANDAFSALPLSERTTIAAYVNELFDRFDNLRFSYLRKSTREDYEWARQIAFNLRAASSMVTCYEAKDRPHPVWNARDATMAANVEWILGRSSGGVVVLAANGHVQRVVCTYVPPTMACAGMYLAQRFGEEYRTVGFTFGGGTMPWLGGPATLPQAEPDSLDGALSRVGLPLSIVNLRALPEGAAAQWLAKPRKQRSFDSYLPYDQRVSWDGLIHVERTSADVPSVEP